MTVDRQRHVHASSVSLHAKRIQSDTLMIDDTFVGFRNRGMIACKTWSVSRHDEAANWDIADLWPFTYEAELATTGCMDIHVLYIQQHVHKQQEVSCCSFGVMD